MQLMLKIIMSEFLLSQHGYLILQVEVPLRLLLHTLHGKHFARLLLFHHEDLWEGPPTRHTNTDGGKGWLDCHYRKTSQESAGFLLRGNEYLSSLGWGLSDFPCFIHVVPPRSLLTMSHGLQGTRMNTWHFQFQRKWYEDIYIVSSLKSSGK